MMDYEQRSNYVSRGVVWVPCEDGLLPNGLNPVFGGVEKDEWTYVARAVHQDNILPGRFIPSKGKCVVGYSQYELSFSRYEVLTKPRGTNLEWALVDQNRDFPDGALVGGRLSSGTKLYIGRVYYDGFGIVGRVFREHKMLYLPSKGCERRIKKFEVLVNSDVTSLMWIDCENGQVPNSLLNPVLSGITPEGETTYVGRARLPQGRYGTHLIPGRVVPSQGKCYVGHGLKEHSYFKYQVLTNPVGVNLEWVPDHNGRVPDGAVVGGQEFEGAKLFVGRAYHDGFAISGKIHPEHKSLYIATGGTEWSLRKYEVLVERDEQAITANNRNHGVTM